MGEQECAIEARGLSLATRHAAVFSGVGFSAGEGSLVAIVGPGGSGKTSLLLTLAGRMRGWTGRVTVCGTDLSRGAARVRTLVGLGTITALNPLSDALTARQHVAEQRLFVPRRQRSAASDVLVRVGLSAMADVKVRDLTAEQRVALGVALALVRAVRVIAVDDADVGMAPADRDVVLALLRRLARDGLTVLYACVDPASAAGADVTVSLDDGTVSYAEEARDEVA